MLAEVLKEYEFLNIKIIFYSTLTLKISNFSNYNDLMQYLGIFSGALYLVLGGDDNDLFSF